MMNTLIDFTIVVTVVILGFFIVLGGFAAGYCKRLMEDTNEDMTYLMKQMESIDEKLAFLIRNS